MTLNYRLRTASARDAENLQRACWPERSVGAVRELLQRAEENTRRGMGVGIVATLPLVAGVTGASEQESFVVGFGQVTIWPRATEISDLIVADSYRSQGIGSAMICFLVDRVRLWHLPRVEIGVALSNSRALALYRRLGFQDDRIINLDLGEGPQPVLYLTMRLEH
jgi:ribosomal protein S18 acetylase RimI-like enzyme